MPKTTPAAGEAMPKAQVYSMLDDAQNKLSEIKDLNEAIFMAANAVGDRDQMNALCTVANIIDQKIGAVEEILTAAREATR
ncbi:hypothetical protein [Rhizobium rhizogenes]|uniref:hypothetical protein n=1 Tax=Rhizobium rhizogenes TaxID=359 RepID=UPI00226D80E3|nr:hypothetical protein [Rhizobium rhizogenes]